jgi:hypothetical protein
VKKILNMNTTLKYLLCAAMLGFMQTAQANIQLYVDSAPNVYGSPNYAGWQANAFMQAANGSFVNMNNSVNPLNAGTTQFDIKDATVYSFGDLGRRLSFVYWVPNETIADLQSHNFALSLLYNWDGVTYDGYDEYYGQTWISPSSWQEYNGGVIGVAGWAWWGAYLQNTQAALDADLAAWDPSQGNITLRIQVDGDTAASLTALHGVPDAASTAVLLGLGFVGLAAFSFKRNRQALAK